MKYLIVSVLLFGSTSMFCQTSKFHAEDLLSGVYNDLIKHSSYLEKIDKYQQDLLYRTNIQNDINQLKVKINFPNLEEETKHKVEQVFSMLTNDNSGDIYSFFRKSENRQLALDLGKIGLLQEIYSLERNYMTSVHDMVDSESWAKKVVEVMNQSPDFFAKNGLFTDLKTHEDIEDLYRYIKSEADRYNKNKKAWRADESGVLLLMRAKGTGPRLQKVYFEYKEQVLRIAIQKKFAPHFEKYLDKNIKILFNPETINWN